MSSQQYTAHVSQPLHEDGSEDDNPATTASTQESPTVQKGRRVSRTRPHTGGSDGGQPANWGGGTRTGHRPSSDNENNQISNGSVRSNKPLLRNQEVEEWEEGENVPEEHDFAPARSSNEQGQAHTYPRRNNSAIRNRNPPRAYYNRPNNPEEPATMTIPASSQRPQSKQSNNEGQSYFQARPPGSQRAPSFLRRNTDLEKGYPQTPGGTNLGMMTPGSKIEWKHLSKEEKAEVMRLPWTGWMDSSIKNHFVAFLGELIGTTMFLFFAFAGTEVANIQSSASQENQDTANSTTGAASGFDVAVLLYISFAFGFSLMVNVWVFFRISGGLFNPAVTFAMWLVKAIDATRAVCLFIAQILGSLLASVIVRFLFPEDFNVRTTLTGATLVQGVFIEAILTAELIFTIFMLAKEKHRATFIAPVGIGLALFIAELAGVQFTGGSLNPARSFGPCVITVTFDQEHWIYWVGPFIGALIAVAFYKLIKILEYELANPGADGDDENDPTRNPEKMAELKRRKSNYTSTNYT